MTARPDFSTGARRRATRPADAVFLGAALLALVVSAHAASAAWADLRQLRRAVDDVRSEADALGARARALDSPRQGEAGDALASRVLLTVEAPPQRVLADLTALLPGDVRVDGITLTYGTRLDVEARVAARHAAAYDLFLKRLGESPRFAAVVPGPENREGEVLASVQMVYSGEAGR